MGMLIVGRIFLGVGIGLANQVSALCTSCPVHASVSVFSRMSSSCACHSCQGAGEAVNTFLTSHAGGTHVHF